MKKILIVSHCILNRASKVENVSPDELKVEDHNRKKLLNYVIDHDIELLQLPCPEFYMYGANRWGHVKNQFDHPFFRKQSRELLESFILQLKEYTSYPEKFQILGIIAIDGSPSCGYQLTCKGDWGGEFTGCTNLTSKLEGLYMAKESGIFMEELKELLKKENLIMPMIDLSAFTEEYCL